jgi:hypothetical protein
VNGQATSANTSITVIRPLLPGGKATTTRRSRI